jgi:hypothetical protein
MPQEAMDGMPWLCGQEKELMRVSAPAAAVS